MKCINKITVLKVIFEVMIFLVDITLFCDQGRKLRRKKKYNVKLKNCVFL